MAGEIRMYVRAVATQLVRRSVIAGIVDLKSLPAEYWKFVNDKDPQTTRKKRSPEFLADTAAALRFAEVYFTAEHLNAEMLPEGAGMAEFCGCLRGPVLQHRRYCFTIGSWMPPNLPYNDVTALTPGVGKRLATIIMDYYFAPGGGAAPLPKLRSQPDSPVHGGPAFEAKHVPMKAEVEYKTEVLRPVSRKPSWPPFILLWINDAGRRSCYCGLTMVAAVHIIGQRQPCGRRALAERGQDAQHRRVPVA